MTSPRTRLSYSDQPGGDDQRLDTVPPLFGDPTGQGPIQDTLRPLYGDPAGKGPLQDIIYRKPKDQDNPSSSWPKRFGWSVLALAVLGGFTALNFFISNAASSSASDVDGPDGGSEAVVADAGVKPVGDTVAEPVGDSDVPVPEVEAAAEDESGRGADDLVAPTITDGQAWLQSEIEKLDETIRLDPANAVAFNDRGIAYQQLGQLERSIEDFGEAIRLDPAYAFPLINRGASYNDLGQYERAIEDYGLAIDLAPNHPFPFNNRGVTYQTIGEYERSIDDFDMAVGLDPNYFVAFHNRGISYYHLGQLELAIESYEEAIRLNPNYEKAKKNWAIAIAELESK